MYHHLAGILQTKRPDEAVIEAGGVGYLLRISLNTYAKLPALGTQTKLFTHLHVAEDALSLIGFATEDERDFFQQLRTVSGIGTTTALAVLSGGNVSDLRGAILRGEVSTLRRARGVGDKTARRIVLE
jgi:Holliday junction DNA helicase RuvA